MNASLSLEERTFRSICSTYARYPLSVKKARGCSLYDFQDREFLDLLAGIAVCGLGHSHPEIVRAIKDQSEKLIHVSNLFYQEEQVLLAEKLLSTCPMDKVFFCNSGAEANEAAVKLVRRYMRNIKKQDRYEILTMSGSFHGRTMASMAATGQDKIKQGFEPLPAGFRTFRFNDVHDLEQAIRPETAAIMVEIIQGEGGIRMLDADFAQAIMQLCRSRDLLLVVDEIQTGLGRTGRFWAFEHLGLAPDMITSAKSLAAGLPMGALLASDETAQAFDAGSHGSTFGGSPLACAAALKALEIIERDGLVHKAEQLGRQARRLFEAVAEDNPGKIREVRGKGLMLGIDLAMPGAGIWKALLDRGFVLNLTQETVLRLLPPLTIEMNQLESFARQLDSLLKTMESRV